MMVPLVFCFLYLNLLLVTANQNDSSSSFGETSVFTHVMQISSNRNFSVVIFLPIHKRGATAFDCGSISDQDLLSQLITLNYAINVTNEEAVLRTGISLGAYIVDDCSQPLRAVQTFYRLLAGTTKSVNESTLNPRSIVAVITTEAAVVKAMNDFLNSLQISLISAFLKPEWEIFPTPLKGIHLISDCTQWLDAVVSFLKAFKVKFISLIMVNAYGRSATDYLLDKLQDDVCVVNHYELSAETELKTLARTIVLSSDGHVILFLSDSHRLTFDFLRVYASTDPASNHVFVVSDQLLSRKSVQILNINVLLVGSVLERQYSNMEDHTQKISLQDHFPINDRWFDEFWQQHFRCSLYPTHSWPLCTGLEKMDNITYSTAADYLSLSVKIAAVGFQNFLTRHCQEYERISNIDQCGPKARSFLLLEIMKAWTGDEQRGQKPLGTTRLQSVIFQLSYRDRHLMENGLKKIAEWSNGTLSFDDTMPVELHNLGLVDFSCVEKFASSCPKIAARIMASNFDLWNNFRTTWGMITASLSALGMLMVLGCTAYLMVVVPSYKGTMILNYMILLGIFGVFGCNFAFIAMPNKIVCTCRRLVMGVAYAIVFSAKLMKVLSIWRTSHHESSTLTSCIMNQHAQDDVKPSFITFVSFAIAFFQGGIATAWLILDSPEVVYDLLQPLCSPGLMFEEGLVLSFFYVMILMVVTFILATVTWKHESNRRESRWIFASTVLVCFIWLVWTLIATQADIKSRNMAIVMGNLLCAIVTFVCLFVPKIFLYNKLLKQAKKLDIRAFYPHSCHSQQNVPSLYDPLQPGSVNSSYSSITGTLTTITNPEHKLKKSISFNKSQPVWRHESYPNVLYDGRSQFSVEQRSSCLPASSRLNAIHDLPPTRTMQNYTGADCY